MIIKRFEDDNYEDFRVNRNNARDDNMKSNLIFVKNNPTDVFSQLQVQFGMFARIYFSTTKIIDYSQNKNTAIFHNPLIEKLRLNNMDINSTIGIVFFMDCLKDVDNLDRHSILSNKDNDVPEIDSHARPLSSDTRSSELSTIKEQASALRNHLSKDQNIPLYLIGLHYAAGSRFSLEDLTDFALDNGFSAVQLMDVSNRAQTLTKLESMIETAKDILEKKHKDHVVLYKCKLKKY